MAVDLVEKRGYVSYNEISRKLGIIYQHSFHIALEMERRGIVASSTRCNRKALFHNKTTP